MVNTSKRMVRQGGRQAGGPTGKMQEKGCMREQAASRRERWRGAGSRQRGTERNEVGVEREGDVISFSVDLF